jgi:hypothetical protein
MYVLNDVSNQLMRLTISDPLVYPIMRFTFLRFEIFSSDNKSVSHWIMFDYFFHV